MALAAVLAMGGCQDVSSRISDLAFERCANVHGLAGRRATSLRACVLQRLLNACPKFFVNDGGMFAGIGRIFVSDHAAIDRIGQNAMDLASAHLCATLNTASCKDTALGAKPKAIGFLCHLVQMSKSSVELE